jgi:hypothetical protein
MDEQVWRLTLSLIDATGKKEIDEFLDFRSRESAETAIQPFERDGERGTSKVFCVTNEDGEYIEFKGGHIRRHSVKKIL